MPKISEHPCERCGHFAVFSVRMIGTAISFYLCKDCMEKPDVCQWTRETVKKKMVVIKRVVIIAEGANK